MDAAEISQQLDRTLERLGRQLEALDVDDLDVEMVPGKVDVELPNGKRLILSRQSATNQIWLAEPAGGWRFDLRDGQWLCDKRGVELVANLEALLGAQLGVGVKLA